MKPFDLEKALAGEPVKGVFGKGIQDIPNAQRDPRYKYQYSRWYNILQRCFSEKFKNNNQTYQRTTICEDWLTFSKFNDWLTSQPNWYEHDIDKDLLSGTHYSPETCLLIPKKLNSFLTFKQNTNSSGYIGVNFYHPKGRTDGVYRASISAKLGGKGTSFHLGHFTDPLQAHLVWLKVKLEMCLDWRDEIIDPKVKNILNILANFMQNKLNKNEAFNGLEEFRLFYKKGMWQEPRLRVQLDLPTPLKEVKQGQRVYFLNLGNFLSPVSSLTYDDNRTSDYELYKNGGLFATKQDAKEWLDAMKNARR